MISILIFKQKMQRLHSSGSLRNSKNAFPSFRLNDEHKNKTDNHNLDEVCFLFVAFFPDSVSCFLSW